MMAAGAGLSGSLGSLLGRSLAGASVRPQPAVSKYGPLAPALPTSVADGVDGGIEWLALPKGFEYAVFGVAGSTMTDGNITPNAHDGMGCFAGKKGRVRLVRNHEVRDGAGVAPPLDAAKAYDPLSPGRTTTLEIAFDRDGIPSVVRDFVSLSGTHTNCAGGITPWKSWLSCEETTAGTPDFGANHGYVFEVPAAANRPVDPEPLTALGRFTHEAACVDPRTGIVYMTEDAGDSGFYRFVPARKGKLAAGTLQMLKVRGTDGYDTRTGQTVGTALPVKWVDITEPDPPLGGKAVYEEGIAGGGAIFRRTEGTVFDRGRVFFTATDGGDALHGQVWSYRPKGDAGGTLTLVFESPDPTILSFPDNIVVSPRGGTVLCEDTARVLPGRAMSDQYLKGLTRDGVVFDFALNLVDAKEWAGACWSPDGDYLFANTLAEQLAGDEPRSRTYAIWGPWRRGNL
ncbi:MAG: DUF839 domain-containing protein [Acidimicrobiia bacterium]